MRPRVNGIVALLTVVTLAVSLPVVGQESEPLKILLTNDDGFDAPGIQAMRRALTAAGHDVTVVAPAEQQSGSSGRVTLLRAPVIVDQRDATGWTIEGSPADAVFVALEHILKDTPPDLVVAGSNFGENVGLGTNASGTVGAAIQAASSVPAIAVSVERRRAERGMTPVAFPSTASAFDPAAAFTARLIATLQQHRRDDDRLLPDWTVLNVNYPARPAAEIRGVKLANVGRTYGDAFVFHETDDPGRLQLAFDPNGRSREPVEDADTTLLSQGYITLSLLAGARTAQPSARAALAARLQDLAAMSPASEGR